MTLGGNVCIRNGNALDYCWKEAVKSLLPICDEVVVCDGESTDGTQEDIRQWMKSEPKIKLCVYPWPDPKGDINFWVNWLNFCREQIHTDWHIQLDADEVLSEKSYPEVLSHLTANRHSVFCRRYNFWDDHRHTLPHGVCLSHRVARIAPTDVWLPSDAPHPMATEAISMAQESGIEIFHYGFLRRREAYYAKSKELQRMFFGTEDQGLTEAESSGANWVRQVGGPVWDGQLVDYTGEHPKVIHQWLAQRGYAV